MQASLTKPITGFDDRLEIGRVFRLLLLYRWLSLIPVTLALAASGAATSSRALLAGLAAVFVNLFISLFPSQLNRVVRRWPALLLADLLFCAALAWGTGGWSTPFYLYAFSPLLVAAFFFELRGALWAASGMAGLFLGAGLLGSGPAVRDWQAQVAQVVGFFLIAGTFGYATTLFARLQSSHGELNRAHRDLEVIHSLTLSLQSAADVNEVEERVLTAVTDELGFPRAVVALVDQSEQVITAWLGRSRNGQPLFAGALPHPARIALSTEGGIIPQTILEGRPRLGLTAVSTPDERVNRNLQDGTFHVFPMILRDHPVGVLIVAESDGADDASDPSRLASLHSIASQAAVAVGTTMLCIDRAQRLAVQDERIRIAREIHDTVSQSLFGMSFSLNACVKLLPAEPERVKAELSDLGQLADEARAQLRRSIMDIWPSEITAESFRADLRKYAADNCQADGLTLDVTVEGELGRLTPGARRGLYRIAQEAVTNVARHSAAGHAEVSLRVNAGEALLEVGDDGRGYVPAEALARERNREHFGLRGIQERAGSLGGQAEFFSQPGSGARLRVTIPVGKT